MFVATILGNPPMNFLRCTVSKGAAGALVVKHETFSVAVKGEGIIGSLSGASKAREVILGVRPEDVKIHLEKSSVPAFDAEVYVTEPLGNETIVDIKLGERVIKVLAQSDFPGQAGRKVRIRMNAHKLHFFDAATHQCLHHTSESDEIEIRPA